MFSFVELEVKGWRQKPQTSNKVLLKRSDFLIAKRSSNAVILK
jgi:hypothetical protein